MSGVIVVDTSVWIEFFRGTDAVVRKLSLLIDEDQVALAMPVRLEILAGAPAREIPRLQRVLGALPQAHPDAGIWSLLEDWIVRAARAGQRFGIADLLVAGIAARASAAVWSLDTDFARMAKLGFVTLAPR